MVRVHAGPLDRRSFCEGGQTKEEKVKEGKPSYAKASAGNGGLAQLARAPALQAGGHRFDSDILHKLIGQLADVLISRLKRD